MGKDTKLASGKLNEILFTDIFNLEDIQRMQDLFADANALASVITNPEGVPITRPSNFCRLCSDIIRKTEKGRANCFKSDAYIGKQCKSGPFFQTCLSGGLLDASASITFGERHIANWLIGQVRNQDMDEKRMIAYADEIGVKHEDFIKAMNEVPVMSVEKFRKISEMLFVFANELSENAYKNLQLKLHIEEKEKNGKLLQASEKRFQSLFYKAPLAYQSLDFDGNLLEINQQWLDTLGYLREEVIGKYFGDFLTPAYLSGFRKQFTVFKAEGKIHIEFEMQHKNGNVLFIALEGRTGLDVKGEFKQTHCILQDITERKYAEEALLESETKYRTLVENSPDTIVIHSEGKILFLNQECIQLVGAKNAEEMIGKPVIEFAHPDYRAFAIERMKRVIDNGVVLPFIEEKFLRLDGSVIDVEVKAMPIKFENKAAIQLIIRDISQRKAAEKLLWESKEKFKAIADYTASWESWFSPEGKLLWMNNYSVNLTGYTPEEFIAAEDFLAMAVIAEDIPIGAEKYRAAINGGNGDHLEVRCLRKDGSCFWASVSWQPILDSNGISLGFRTSVQDISEQKQAEESLRLKQRQLADIIDFLPDATLAIDKEKRIIIWNKAIEKMTGIPASEMIGKGNYAYTIPFYGEARSQLMDLVFVNDKEVIARYPHITRDGDTLTAEFFCNALYHNKGAWIFAKVSPLHDENGNIIGAIESLRDISEAKQLENALKISEEQFRLGFDYANVGMCLLDTNGLFLKVNYHLCEMFGYRREELEGMNVNDITHPDYVDTSKNYIRLALKGEIDHAEFEKAYINKQGRLVLGLVSFSLVRNANAEPMYFISYVLDITEKKKVNEELSKQKYFFEQMFMQSSVSTQILDAEGWCQRINAKLTEIFGVEANDIEGKVYNIFKDEAIIQNGILPYLESVFYQGKTAEWEVFFDIGVAADSQNIHVKEKKKVWYANWAYPILDENGKISNVVIQHNNISDQKFAQESLKVSEERFRAISEYSFSSIFIVNESAKIIWANEAMLKMSNYSKKEFNTSASFAQFIAEESLDFVMANFIKLVKNEEFKHHCEFYFVRSDGEKRLCEKYMTHFKDSGNNLNVVISMMDITKRKQSEEALKISEDKYRTMIEFSNDLIWSLDKEGKFTFFNDIVTKTTGLKLEEWKGKSFLPLIFEEDLPVILDVFHKGLNGEACNYELRFKKSDDIILTISVNTSPVYINGKIEGVVSFGHNITESKQAEITIRELGKHYQALIEKAPDGIVLLSEEGNFIFASPAATRMFGYELSDYIGKNPAEFTHPDDLYVILIALEKLYRDPSFVPTLQYRFIDKKGNWKWIESTFSNLLADPCVKSVVINFRDISERKQDEQALKEKMEDLQRLHNITVGRELTMIELKKEVNKLLKINGLNEKYKIVE